MAANAERGTVRDMALLQQRAAAVAAFKARIQVDGMTRPSRSAIERAFLVGIGVSMPFRESGTPFQVR
jgi:hypothetical protein